MSGSGRHSAEAQMGVTRVLQTIPGSAGSSLRLCFIVEEKYENDVMPAVVADALTSWGHEVEVLRPHSTLADVSTLTDRGRGDFDAYVLKTVSSGPGLSILEAAGAAGIPTVNNYRAIRLARDKAVAASVARAAGIPFPTTYFASRSGLLDQVPRERYPLVVKPNNGSSCEQIFRVESPDQLGRLELDDSGYLLAQPYLPNPGYDVKLYNTGAEVFAAVRQSPLHPSRDVVEQLIPVTPELQALTFAVGRAFGLDIYGIDVVQTPRGWVVLDVNDFPSFGRVPDVAWRLARTVLRLARSAAAGLSDPSLPSLRFTPAMEATA
jgi:ribosomal protein S6--L-glutamate ligase